MSKAPAVRTRNPKAETRSTILAKAYEMYVSRELVHGDERLSAVLDELGYTTGAGYQIWANQAAFRADLQIYIAENIEYASPEIVAEDIAALAMADLSRPEFILGVADLYAVGILGSDAFYISLRFFGMADNRPDAITEALKDGYERSSWQVEERLERAMLALGIRMRDGLLLQDLVVAITALIEGYALRATVQPDRAKKRVTVDKAEHHAFAYAFLGVVQGFTDEID